MSSLPPSTDELAHPDVVAQLVALGERLDLIEDAAAHRHAEVVGRIEALAASAVQLVGIIGDITPRLRALLDSRPARALVAWRTPPERRHG